MIYIYCRVSTDQQNETSLEVQEATVRRQVAHINDEITVIKEVGSAKDTEKRPKFIRMLSELRKGDTVAVFDPSRFFRETEMSLHVFKMIYDKGATFLYDGREVDPDNPQDKMMFTVHSAFSTFQREIQAQKSMLGIGITKMAGNWVTVNTFGYDVIRINGRVSISVNETEAYYLRYIFDEYSKGRSCRSLAKELEQITFEGKKMRLNAGVIRRMIFRPVYMGYSATKTITGKNKEDYIYKLSEESLREILVRSNYYPAIVSEELWWSCFRSFRKVVRGNGRQFEYRYSAYELSGVLKSRCCGHALYHSYHKMRNGGTEEYYVLNDHNPGCNVKEKISMKKSVMEFMMRSCYLMTFCYPMEAGMFFMDQKALAENSMEELSRQKELLNERISECSRKMNNLIDLATNGIDPAIFKSKLAELSEEKKGYEEELKTVNRSVRQKEIDIEDFIIDTSEESIMEFCHGSAEYRRKQFIKLCNAIVDYGEIEINFYNGKKYIIQNYRRKQKKIGALRFSMYFNGELQETGTFDYMSNSIDIDRLEGQDENVAYGNRLNAEITDKVNGLLKEIV